MIDYIRKLLTGLDAAERTVLKREIAERTEQERHRDFLGMLERLPDMIRAAVVHSHKLNAKGSHYEDAAECLRLVAEATKIALPYARKNPSDFQDWFENHGPGKLFASDALKASNKARGE